MYGEKLPPEVQKIRHELLSRIHTWFLVDGIMWHIGARYHPAGISSGRSIMSCILDSWSLVSPTRRICVGPGMVISQEWWNPDELIAELCLRPKMHGPGQIVFTKFGLQALTFEELTILTLEVMRRGTANMINYHEWHGLSNTRYWIKSLLNYFGKNSMPDKFRFLPRVMFGSELPQLNSHIRALIDEIESRRDRVVLSPYEGLVPATVEEKQTPFE